MLIVLISCEEGVSLLILPWSSPQGSHSWHQYLQQQTNLNVTNYLSGNCMHCIFQWMVNEWTGKPRAATEVDIIMLEMPSLKSCSVKSRSCWSWRQGDGHVMVFILKTGTSLKDQVQMKETKFRTNVRDIDWHLDTHNYDCNWWEKSKELQRQSTFSSVLRMQQTSGTKAHLYWFTSPLCEQFEQKRRLSNEQVEHSKVLLSIRLCRILNGRSFAVLATMQCQWRVSVLQKLGEHLIHILKPSDSSD